MYTYYSSPRLIAEPNATKHRSSVSKYRPTWLIRVSDWQKVPGKEAKNGYHALSYCWEQSGTTSLKEDGEYEIIDEGQHIIFGEERRSTSFWDFFRRHRQYGRVRRVRLGTYDSLLQQLCQDFNIEFLWYDKICIDQNNEAEKLREIKQMHLIYSSAHYTVALVPELVLSDGHSEYVATLKYLQGTRDEHTARAQVANSKWLKRSWTLLEVMMSSRIVIVGGNMHFWELAYNEQDDKSKEGYRLLDNIIGFKYKKVKSASQVLHHAHFRTSTKKHDHIFALANIFEGVVPVEVNYDIDISTVVNNFYRGLINRDLSIMCFGSVEIGSQKERSHITTMASYCLPSWTGVDGIHSIYPVARTVIDQGGDFHVESNMDLHIRCRGYTIRNVKEHDDPVACISKTIQADDYSDLIRERFSTNGFGGDEKEEIEWSLYTLFRGIGSCGTHYWKPDCKHGLSLPIIPLSLTETCDECIILGIIFDIIHEPTKTRQSVGFYHFYVSPVAKKTDDLKYKIIGLALMKHSPRPGSPQSIIDKLFSGSCCKATDFCFK